MQQLGQRWKSLSVEERARFEQQAAWKRAFDDELEEYKASGRAARWRAAIMRHLEPLDAFQDFYSEVRAAAPSTTKHVAQEK